MFGSSNSRRQSKRGKRLPLFNTSNMPSEGRKLSEKANIYLGPNYNQGAYDGLLIKMKNLETGASKHKLKFYEKRIVSRITGFAHPIEDYRQFVNGSPEQITHIVGESQQIPKTGEPLWSQNKDVSLDQTGYAEMLLESIETLLKDYKFIDSTMRPRVCQPQPFVVEGKAVFFSTNEETEELEINDTRRFQ